MRALDSLVLGHFYKTHIVLYPSSSIKIILRRVVSIFQFRSFKLEENALYWHYTRQARPTYRGHIACRPPSTQRFTPVIKLDCSLARKAIASATSCGLPGRPSA